MSPGTNGDDTVIRVEGLGKQFHIGAARKKAKSFRDLFTNTITTPFRRAKRLLSGHGASAADLEETLWALREVSFEVKRGAVVGVIGRNGAGKSTLLKILTRITEPSEGFAEICGRVGSLLEVGSGFHPEMTGRENIYLNGVILGMKRSEIDKKFDEIVAFSEVEKFLDTPVKHYSSGMYLRLAFAVAAHLEAEILLVDEVLAVGDARFQKKCMNKMQDVGQEGRTVIFVSHNMAAVTRLCERAILLEGGRVAADGQSQHVVVQYLNSGLGTTAAREWPDIGTAPGGDVGRLRAVRVKGEDGRITETVDIRRPVDLELEFEVLVPGYVLLPHFQLYNEEGVCLLTTLDSDPAWRRRPRPAGRYVSTVRIPGNFFAEGTVVVEPWLITATSLFQFREPDAVVFHVTDSLDGDAARGDYAETIPGLVRPLFHWTTRYEPGGAAAGP